MNVQRIHIQQNVLEVDFWYCGVATVPLASGKCHLLCTV